MKAADLSNELQGSGSDFVLGGRGFEVEEGLDAAAHVSKIYREKGVCTLVAGANSREPNDRA